jgi:hypothetical protein
MNPGAREDRRGIALGGDDPLREQCSEVIGLRIASGRGGGDAREGR